MNQEKINRINELYKKQKAGSITPEEKRRAVPFFEQSILLQFCNNLRNTLEHTSIQEPDGTIHKLRKKETH